MKNIDELAIAILNKIGDKFVLSIQKSGEYDYLVKEIAKMLETFREEIEENVIENRSDFGLRSEDDVPIQNEAFS